MDQMKRVVNLMNARLRRENSILASDMIEILRGLIEYHGDDVRVCITQEGYTADAQFADIGEIRCLGKDDRGNEVVSIGNSEQRV